jgi:uncharacterized protein DUF6309
MYIQRRATYDEVKSKFLEDNLATPERNGWPLGALEIANIQFGNWAQVILGPDDVLTVLLPKHDHEVNLVPAAGSNVLEAVTKFETMNQLTECYKRIQQFSNPATPIVFLSVKPIEHPHYSDYHGLITRGCCALTHLDGLHRLVAWGFENKRDVPAYVAGLT